MKCLISFVRLRRAVRNGNENILFSTFKHLSRRGRMVYGERGKKVSGSNPTGNIYFHFEFFAPFSFLTARRSQYKWNEAWNSSQSNRRIERCLICVSALTITKVTKSSTSEFLLVKHTFGLERWRLYGQSSQPLRKLVLHVLNTKCIFSLYYFIELSCSSSLQTLLSKIQCICFKTFALFNIAGEQRGGKVWPVKIK